MLTRIQKVRDLGFSGMVELIKRACLEQQISLPMLRAEMTELLNIYMIMHGKFVKKKPNLNSVLSQIEDNVDSNSPDKNYIKDQLQDHIKEIESIIGCPDLPKKIIEDTKGVVEGLKILTPPHLFFSKKAKTNNIIPAATDLTVNWSLEPKIESQEESSDKCLERPCQLSCTIM